MQKGLPKNWERVPLGSVVKLNYGKALPEGNRQEGNYPVYGSNGIVGRHNKFLVEYPTIIVGRKGSVGKVNLEKKPCWVIDTAFYTEILDQRVLNIDYLFLVLKLFEEKLIFPKGVKPGINRDEYLRNILPLPPLQEQKRIVEKIDKLFALIDKSTEETKKSLVDSQKILQSELEKTFSNKNYNSFELGELLDINWGNTSITKKQYVHDGFPAYSATGQDGFLEKYEHEGKAIILSAIGARCGKCFLANDKWTAIKNTMVMKAKDKKAINYEYFFYYLNDEKKWKAKGAGQPFISQSKANKIPIFLPVKKNGSPDLDEQKKIVTRLDKIQEYSKNLEAICKEQLKNLEILKQSILEKAFRGELVKEEEEKPIPFLIPSPFSVQQAIGAILQRNFERGEMVLAKMLYFAQEIFGVPLKIPFTAQPFGPYDIAIKKIISVGANKKNQFFARKQYGKGYIYTLGKNYQKSFSKYQNARVVREMNQFLNKMLPDFKKANSKAIERLATTCKVIQDSKDTDIDKIWESISEWKPGKFTKQDVEKSLNFIKSKNWDKVLIK